MKEGEDDDDARPATIEVFSGLYVNENAEIIEGADDSVFAEKVNFLIDFIYFSLTSIIVDFIFFFFFIRSMHRNLTMLCACLNAVLLSELPLPV